MEREQIIKALECCTLEGCHDCRECPQGNVLLSLCKKNAMADALSLIKELTNEKFDIECSYKAVKRDNERLHGTCTELARNLHASVQV